MFRVDNAKLEVVFLGLGMKIIWKNLDWDSAQYVVEKQFWGYVLISAGHI